MRKEKENKMLELTIAELKIVCKNETRNHVFRLLDELQKISDKKMSVQHFILLKRQLFENYKN